MAHRRGEETGGSTSKLGRNEYLDCLWTATHLKKCALTSAQVKIEPCLRSTNQVAVSRACADGSRRTGASAHHIGEIQGSCDEDSTLAIRAVAYVARGFIRDFGLRGR